MNIKINVIGGTHKNVRALVLINDAKVGDIQPTREDFTDFCDLLYPEGYTMAGGSSPDISLPVETPQ